MRIFSVFVLSILATFWIDVSRANDGLSDQEVSFWAAVNTGSTFVLMRHALAPGNSDPDNFDVNDCATQRNLSQAGRNQAKTIGERLKKNAQVELTVFSSQWCRCLETARQLGLGEVAPLPSLNSFYQRYEREKQQTESTVDWMSKRNAKGSAVLVTHQVNITELTGIYPDSGEMVVVKIADGGVVQVLGRLRTTVEP